MALSNRQIEAKLKKLVMIANELDAEAKRRWGADGNLFYEAEGTFYLMRGDSLGGAAERQEFVEFKSRQPCRLGAGAW